MDQWLMTESWWVLGSWHFLIFPESWSYSYFYWNSWATQYHRETPWKVLVERKRPKVLPNVDITQYYFFQENLFVSPYWEIIERTQKLLLLQKQLREGVTLRKQWALINRDVLFEFYLKFWNTASIGIPVSSLLLTGLTSQ